MARLLRMSRSGKNQPGAQTRDLESQESPQVNFVPSAKDVDSTIPLHSGDPEKHDKNGLAAVINELKSITHKIKEDSGATEEGNDCKFAAMVIDRLCLLVFSVYLAVATIAIFFSVL